MLATVPLDRLYLLFAAALDYPGPALAEDARACRGLLAQFSSEAAGRMEEFGVFLAQTHPGQVQEVYTNAFDLQPVCYPYVGYQLFGESYKRGMFLVKLQEEYRARGFSAGSELPDHLPVMLRFLSVLAARGDTELEDELVCQCVAPALSKIVGAFKDKGNPYGVVARALLDTLKKVFPQAVESIDAAPAAASAFMAPCCQPEEG